MRAKQLNKKVSQETKKKQSDAAKKRIKETGKAIPSNVFGLGSKHSITAQIKISMAVKGVKRKYKPRPHKAGENSPFWRGGVSTENDRIKHSQKYKEWRKAVYERDDYTCQECGERGGELNADHIKPFAHFPELRFDVNNGRTLCVECHKKTDTWGSRTMWRKYEKG